MHKLPSTPLPSIISPSLLTRIGSTPGRGKVAYEGFSGVIPARGEIRIPPVSVCHHVSTIGHCFLPMWSLYQCHASSLMGSPTVPRTLKLLRSLDVTKPKSQACKALIAVGAV